jgi:hypothetical protein
MAEQRRQGGGVGDVIDGDDVDASLVAGAEKARSMRPNPLMATRTGIGLLGTGLLRTVGPAIRVAIRGAPRSCP